MRRRCCRACVPDSGGTRMKKLSRVCAYGAAEMPAGASRRRFLAGGLAALGLAASRASAQAPAKTVIDVHHHVAPPAYAQELIARGLDEPPLLHWSVQKSLDDMDRAG